MTTLLIGIDDTDNPTSPGTGRLARRVLAACAERGLEPVGVTRYQFLLDPAIRYTSHNSGACVVVRTDRGVEAVRFAADLVAEHAAEGSDPGVCIALEEAATASVQDFGRAAATTVLTVPQAFAVARMAGLRLYGLGGTCEGVIGAVASVGQYAAGDQGRFIDLPGLRDLTGCVTRERFEGLGIALDHLGPRQVRPGDLYETLDWVRPRLVEKRPVLPVTWSEDRHAWTPVDCKKSRPLD